MRSSASPFRRRRCTERVSRARLGGARAAVGTASSCLLQGRATATALLPAIAGCGVRRAGQGLRSICSRVHAVVARTAAKFRRGRSADSLAGHESRPYPCPTRQPHQSEHVHGLPARSRRGALRVPVNQHRATQCRLPPGHVCCATRGKTWPFPRSCSTLRGSMCRDRKDVVAQGQPAAGVTRTLFNPAPDRRTQEICSGGLKCPRRQLQHTDSESETDRCPASPTRAESS